MNNKEKLIILCAFLFCAFTFMAGLILGYHAGIQNTVNFMANIMGKVQIDNLKLSFNETKIDEAISQMKNILLNASELAKNKTL